VLDVRDVSLAETACERFVDDSQLVGHVLCDCNCSSLEQRWLDVDYGGNTDGRRDDFLHDDRV
jgi:hypothetical protein